MKRILPAILLALAAIARADANWELVSLTPFPVDGASPSEWQVSTLGSLYQAGGGFAAAGREAEQPVSKEPTLQNAAFRLEHGSWGFGVSELKSDFNLGEYCTDFPAGEIDWEATRDAIMNSDAFREGSIFFVDSATNDEKRVLFTRGGEISVPWRVVGPSGAVDATQSYTVGHSSWARPYRIFWTEHPFGGPRIDLSAHPDVRLLGDPDIVQPVWEATATSATTGISNLVRGVYFDSQSKTLACYARVVDEAAGLFDGPEGQFVLAYYDSGTKDNLVATIVVEACRPDVSIIRANVGDELRPLGGGYDVEGLESEIAAGYAVSTGDDASPFLYKHNGQTNWSPKDDAVFALSPTDETTSKTGASAPWRAEIYWKEPDQMNVLWPFEQDWYEISWPEDAPVFVVSGDEENPGLPIFAPTNYTVEVCDYQSPANIASAGTDKCVSAKGAGWFTIRMRGDDNIWFQPVRAVLRTDPEVATTNAARWEIGSEVSLLGGAAAGNSAAAAQKADSSLPGYIYAAATTDRENWNPRLYHEPKQASESDAIDDGKVEDPYEGLASAIYLVNTSDSPVEVWWSREVVQEGMAAPLRIPCVAQRYEAVWPDERDVQQIVIASQKGSDGQMAGASAAALFLNASNDMARLAPGGELTPGLSGGLTVGLWAILSPVEAGRPAVEDGLLATLWTPGENDGISFRLTDDGTKFALSRTSDAGATWTDLGTADAPADAWTHLALVLDPATNGSARAARLFADAREVWSDALDLPILTNDLSLVLGAWTPLVGGGYRPGAAGVALDGVSAWLLPLSAEQLAETWQKLGGSAEADLTLQCRFDFDGDADLEPVAMTPTRYAADSAGWRTLVSNGPLKMSPGAPQLSSGIVTSDADVPAEVYYENDPGKTGFNPNDEHAFLLDAPAGKVVHALRCDLASDEGSPPLVLVQFAREGRGAMRAYGVMLTNDVYSAFGSERTVGLMFTPPHPLDTLDFANNEKSYSLTVPATCTNSFGEPSWDSEVVYLDHFKRMWARRDGRTDVYYYYATREGFWFPGLSAQPVAGTFVPWLARATNATANVLSGAPAPWRWNVVWPDDSEIPAMRVGQTLTKADGGLPEVWNASSMGIAFPAVEFWDAVLGLKSRERVVHLIDPTVAQTNHLDVSKSFPDEYGFTLGSTGTTQLRKGKYYFTGLPPSIADRFYVDAANQKMCLVGQYVEKKAGGSYLQLNVLTPAEREAVRGLCTMPVGSVARVAWEEAVDGLATEEVVASETIRKLFVIPETRGTNAWNAVVTGYLPVDHYALVASGEGTGYVTLVENDSDDTSMVPEGSPVSMHVIKVLPELYAGGLTVLTDPLNKLSEQLTIAYTAPFGEAADDFEFEWRRVETPADGSVPSDYPDWRVYGTVSNGLVSILLGAKGADLKDLQNMYYAMRYRAKKGTTPYDVTGDRWSDWCGPTLAEGWVQRVLNALTPFAQRVADFESYTSDLDFSMLEQIGAPYHGDVALSNDNLPEVGLLELYRTVLNRAESMSLKLGAKTDAGVNKQLLLAASRIADLYGILGDEAYSDAKNPTVGADFVGNSSVFCFQNQLPTLLEEELALLRGRTSSVSTNMTTYPYYNRLIWNFTKGITEGEVAYVSNYRIRGENGEITQEQAAAQYPQGHGDAYGHYLSMLKSFYHLVRNPYFDWYASMMEMLVGSSIVNMDYYDENKFAEAAGKLARTAMDTMDLTARKAWKDADGTVGAGYFDADRTQAFGYGEWATRGGYGAICNWAVVNSLLPTNGTPAEPVFEDRGIRRVDRATAVSLEYLPAAVAAIERKLAALDAGMNPLGLSDNAIPFDIEPGSTPHFEQVLARAEKAVGNAQTVLDYANRFGSRLAQIADSEGTAAEKQEKTESDYRKSLVAIYGTPLDGDIGPGGIYAQGYDGPDIYHYMYIDLAPYGLSAVDSALSTNVVSYRLERDGPVAGVAWLNYEPAGDAVEIVYHLTPDGIPQAPSASGVRRTEGSIQSAYRSFLAAYVKAKNAAAAYDKSVSVLKVQCDIAKEKLRMAAADLFFDEALHAMKGIKLGIDFGTERIIDGATMVAKSVTNMTACIDAATPKIVGAGLTVNVDPSAVTGAITSTANATADMAATVAISAAKWTAATWALACGEVENAVKMVTDGFDFYNAEVSSWERLKSAVDSVNSAANALRDAYASLVSAEQSYRAQIAKGDELREELAMVRRQWANAATATRYADMYNRIQRNDALTKYNTAYDTAQRYVWLLAKVYDYETGLLSSDPLAGDAFLRETIAARSLGTKGIATATGGTLADAVARMSANWSVLKGRLGINNPETTTKWFSLRYSLFRIMRGAEGDKAWRDALQACWRDDLWADPEIARYCQPPQGSSAPAAAEPGLVISFPTAVNLAENFFGRPLLGGETTYSSSDYAVKISGVGIQFDGYAGLAVESQDGLAVDPNVYLVPVGLDYMRAPSGTTRKTLAFRVVDQVMPVPYDGGALEAVVGGDDWVSALASGDDAATIRRHSTMAVGDGAVASTRLAGRSVWNDRWILVIPASSLSSDRVNALKTFIHGLDADKDGRIDVPGVSDIKIGLTAYSRSGN